MEKKTLYDQKQVQDMMAALKRAFPGCNLMSAAEFPTTGQIGIMIHAKPGLIYRIAFNKMSDDIPFGKTLHAYDTSNTPISITKLIINNYSSGLKYDHATSFFSILPVNKSSDGNGYMEDAWVHINWDWFVDFLIADSRDLLV